MTGILDFWSVSSGPVTDATNAIHRRWYRHPLVVAAGGVLWWLACALLAVFLGVFSDFPCGGKELCKGFSHVNWFAFVLLLPLTALLIPWLMHLLNRAVRKADLLLNPLPPNDIAFSDYARRALRERFSIVSGSLAMLTLVLVLVADYGDILAPVVPRLRSDEADWTNHCVASPTSGQTGRRKMRDFELLQASCRQSEVDEQTRISTIYGGAEDRDPTRGGSARRDGERGLPAPQPIALGAVSVACGGARRLRGGTEARCAAQAPQG